MKCPTINRTLLPLKIVLFCWYGASSSLIPYMTIHMRELGITVSETAIIYTLLPVTQLFCTPLAGMIADKLGRYKDVLMLSVLFSVAFATAILFVPAVPGPRVEHPDIHLHCGAVSLPHIAVENCWDGPCDIFSENRNHLLAIEGCSTFCSGGTDLPTVDIDKLCDDHLNNTSECYFATMPHYSLSDSNYSLWMNFGNPFQERSSCLYPIRNVIPLELSEDYSGMEDVLSPAYKPSKMSCPIVVHEGGRNCSLKCSFKALPEYGNATVPHINRCIRTTGNRVLTFWLYFFLRILFNIFISICLTLLDATAIAMVEAHGGHYGRQRFWAILAQAVFSPVTGFLVDLLSQHRGYQDYSPAFHSYNVLAVCTAIAVWVMSVDVPPPAENVLKNFRKLLRVPPVIVLMIVVFWLGAMWGFVESFLFWYLQDLGSPNFLLGLTLTTGAIVGLPFLHESNWFVKRVGQVNLLLLALFFYFVRFFGYSYINDPWWCIPFEAMEAFTYHLMWVAAATYSAELAPQGLLATIQGCVGGLHYGVGRGSGSFAGGTMMDQFGARLAFRVMGLAAGVMLILYGALYYCWLRQYDGRLKRGSRPSAPPPTPEGELELAALKVDTTDVCDANNKDANEVGDNDMRSETKPNTLEVAADVHVNEVDEESDTTTAPQVTENGEIFSGC